MSPSRFEALRLRTDIRFDWVRADWAWDEPWLQSIAAGFVRTNPLILALAERLAELATENAPAFLAKEYEIAVDALSPELWKGAGARVAVSLRPKRGADLVSLRLAASGMAVWAGYAVGDAIRRMGDAISRLGEGEQEPPAVLDRLLVELFGSERWQALETEMSPIPSAMDSGVDVSADDEFPDFGPL